MGKSNKLLNLTEVFNPQNLYEEVDCGLMAFNNFKYKQAYNHFYKVYKSVDCPEDLKGKVCYYLALTFLYAEDEIIEEIEKDNKELIKARKEKGKLEGKEARKILNREYLYEGAKLGNVKALIEYGLNCVYMGISSDFCFDVTAKNREIGLNWAKKLMEKENREAKVAAYLIRGRYYLYKSMEEATQFNLNNYCYNVLEAYKLDSNDQRACYQMAFMAGDSRIRSLDAYKKYYNVRDSYDLYIRAKKILDEEDYPDTTILANIDKRISTSYAQLNSR